MVRKNNQPPPEIIIQRPIEQFPNTEDDLFMKKNLKN